MNKNKKGIQLNQAVMAILSIVLVAVLIIVSIFLFSSLGDSMMTPGTTGVKVNETLTTVTETGETLLASTYVDGVCGTATSVINATDGVAIPAANRTQTGCVIKYSGPAGNFNNTNWKVSYPYTYTAATSASNASDVTITNFSQYPALVGLVGTIIFLGIIIGVLVASFVFGKKEGA